MKSIIEQINQATLDKGVRLKEKTAQRLAALVSEIGLEKESVTSTTSKGRKIPPIAYLLYGAAGLCSMCALATDTKLLWGVAAAASAYGGYHFSKSREGNISSSVGASPRNFDIIRNKVTSKVLDIIKLISQEWEEFMGTKQREVYLLIDNSTLSTEEKQEKLAQVFAYEVIDVSRADLIERMKTMTCFSDLKNAVTTFQHEVTIAIDKATHKQIEKYNSIV